MFERILRVVDSSFMPHGLLSLAKGLRPGSLDREGLEVALGRK